MRLIGFLAAILFLSACATGVRPAFMRDGRQVYEAKCNGTARTITDCHAQASQKCNGSYEEMGQDGSSSPFIAGGNLYMSKHRSLMFRCKPGKVAPPSL